MKREEILAMEPGRELDALVALLVFGLKEITVVGKYYFIDPLDTVLPLYSTDISAALEVMEKMREELFSKRRKFMDELSFVVRHEQNQPIAWPDVMWFLKPKHYCKAALLATIS